nr:GIY-YIG nuclease family protein [uncultured Acetobacterium sp.]
MRKSETKKEIITAYKEKKSVGGIYIIRNTRSGKLFLDATPNIVGIENRFEFSKKTKLCFTIKLQKEWTPENSDDFTIEILEELEMRADQTKKSFKEDLEILKKMWQEKLVGECFY